MIFVRAVFALVTLFAGLQFAQANGVEWDKKVTHGKLDNGLSYILYDSKRADEPFNIRLVVHAGSVDEEIPRGTAHILEHMVFQSTQAHPETLHTYFQKLGWRTGVQINAVTREAETQFMVRTRPNDALDVEGSLALVADMAFGAKLLAEDWDKERFVILEELRHDNKVAERINRQKKELLRAGSRYVDRPTIGTREGIEATTIADIKAFYDIYYVASNMTLIVSGRIDAASTEKAIISLFGSAPNKPQPSRDYVAFPLKDELSIGQVQDPQGTTSQVTYAFRLEMPPRQSDDGRLAYLEKYFLTRLMRDAIQTQGEHYGEMVNSLSFVIQEPVERRLILAFNARSENHDRAKDILLESVERLRRTGLSRDGFDALMKDAVRINSRNPDAAAQRTYAEWEDRITSAVMMDSVLQDAAEKARDTQALLEQITFESLSARMQDMLRAPDQVMMYQVPGDKTVELPSVDDISAQRQALSTVTALPDLPAIVAKAPVAKEQPLPIWPTDATVDETGEIVSETRHDNPTIQEWVLSNGDRVVWLARDTTDGKVYLSGQSRPGFMNAEFGSTVSQAAIQLWEQSGFNFWSQDEYELWKKAQPARWSWALKDSMLDVAVAAKPEQLPELLRQYAASIKFGLVREEASDAFRTQMASNLTSANEYSQLLYGESADHPCDANIGVIDAQALEKAARALVAEPVTWFAVGPAPTPETKTTFAKTVSALARAPSLTPAPARQQDGIHKKSIQTFRDHRAQVEISTFTALEWTPEKAFLISTLTPLAQQALKNELRNHLGGIYTLQFELRMDPETNRSISTLSFICAPERAEELADAAINVLKNMPQNIQAVDFKRLQADIDFAESGRMSDANTWLRRLSLSYRRYGDPTYLTNMPKLSEQLTPIALQTYAEQVFKTDNIAVLTRLPLAKAQ